MNKRDIEIKNLIDDTIMDLANQLATDHAVGCARFVRELRAGLERYSDHLIYNGFATINEAYPPEDGK